MSYEERQMEARMKEAAAWPLKPNSVHAVDQCATDAQSCGRLSARAVLEQRYDALLREANGIHALLQALPGSMGHLAEEALWRIVAK